MLRYVWNYRTLRMWICLAFILMVQSQAVSARHRLDLQINRIRNVIADLKAELDIPIEIQPIVVPKNDLVVSVEPIRGKKVVFQVSFEEAFLYMLNDNDLRAVVAHELGHVWIFTHHPYLHTEELANSIAERIISREAMDRVYDKLQLRLAAVPGLAAKK